MLTALCGTIFSPNSDWRLGVRQDKRPEHSRRKGLSFMRAAEARESTDCLTIDSS